MKNIKRDFSLKVCVGSPGWALVVGPPPNILFSEYGHVGYLIKWKETYDKIHAHTSLLHAHLTPELGRKVKTAFILKVVMLHINL